MTIKDFKNTEAGRRFDFTGCADTWEVEHYTSMTEYIAILEQNGWDLDDIAEQVAYIKATAYRPNDGGNDFAEVIN